MKRALEGVKVGDVLYHERSSERGGVLRVENRVVRVGRKYLYIKEVIATPKGSLPERLGKKEISISIETGVADGHFGRFEPPRVFDSCEVGDEIEFDSRHVAGIGKKKRAPSTKKPWWKFW